MSATKHSPGPWRTHNSGHPDNVTVIKAADNAIIADVFGYDRDDARLIAAAPDMLAALSLAGKFLADNYVDADMPDILPAVRAALAKAGL